MDSRGGWLKTLCFMSTRPVEQWIQDAGSGAHGVASNFMGRRDTLYASDVNAGAVTMVKEGKILDVIHVEGLPHGLSVDTTTPDVYTSSSVAQSPNGSKREKEDRFELTVGWTRMFAHSRFVFSLRI